MINLKIILFYVLTIVITLVIIFAILISPLIASKLTKSYSYCNAYGEKDDMLGWVLKKSHKSCLSFKNLIKNETYFDTEIILNQYGFRDDKLINNETPDIVFIGDSWTFGYGVDNKDTIASNIKNITDFNIINMGVPNYSSLQSIMLYERYKEQFNPKYVIFLNSNIIERALCKKDLVKYTLEPCYSIFNNKAEVFLPDSSYLELSLNKNIYPSGFHTAGYDFFEFYFFYKPKQILRNIFKKFNLHINDFSADVRSDYFSKTEQEKLSKLELSLLSKISDEDTTLINIMMYKDSIYLNEHINFIKNNFNFINLDNEWYKLNINNRIKDLKNSGKIKIDGHYNEQANKVIAEAIYRVISNLD